MQLTFQNERWSIVLKASFAVSVFLQMLDRKDKPVVEFVEVIF